MTSLKEVMGVTEVLQKSIPYMTNDSIPYMGVSIQTRGITEWDYDKFFKDEVRVQHPEDDTYANDRRSIHDMSMYNYIFGIPRIGFDLMTCNVIKSNPFFILYQSIIFDYLRQCKFNVVDKDGNRVDKLYEWFKHPNPQQSFWEVWLSALGDMFAYDAGVVTATYNKGGWLRELHAYRGIEFWAEVDRMMFKGAGAGLESSSAPYMSHGYITSWWQHTANGRFVRHRPEEVYYLKRYPQSGSVYGQDVMKFFRFHFRGLMSATVAYGKIMDNGLNAGVVIKHPDIGSIEILQERLEGLRKVNVGPTNYGKPLHLIGQEDISTVSNNNLMNQQYVEGVRFNNSLLANMFGLPSSEFSLDGGSMSRNGSYNQKDIRKSRGIGSILSIIEEQCQLILTRLKGYKDGYQFYFEEFSDIDDQLKQAYVVSQNMTSFKMACPNAIFPADVALKLTSFAKQLSPEERDRIYDMIEEMPEGDNTTPSRTGRYDGDDFQETYMPLKDISMNMNEMTDLRHPENR